MDAESYGKDVVLAALALYGTVTTWLAAYLSRPNINCFKFPSRTDKSCDFVLRSYSPRDETTELHIVVTSVGGLASLCSLLVVAGPWLRKDKPITVEGDGLVVKLGGFPAEGAIGFRVRTDGLPPDIAVHPRSPVKPRQFEVVTLVEKTIVRDGKQVTIHVPPPQKRGPTFARATIGALTATLSYAGLRYLCLVLQVTSDGPDLWDLGLLVACATAAASLYVVINPFRGKSTIAGGLNFDDANAEWPLAQSQTGSDTKAIASPAAVQV